jgi:hypothetical protein
MTKPNLIDSIKLTEDDEKRFRELLKEGRELQEAVRKKVAPLQKVERHRARNINFLPWW